MELINTKSKKYVFLCARQNKEMFKQGVLRVVELGSSFVSWVKISDLIPSYTDDDDVGGAKIYPILEQGSCKDVPVRPFLKNHTVATKGGAE